jgi:chromosome partitioning protein
MDRSAADSLSSGRRALGAARVIAVGNLKGGTGKSTVAVNVACAIAAQGRSCAIVDTDPQGTAMCWAAGGRLPVACWAQPLRALDDAGDWLATTAALRHRYDLLVIDLPSVARHAFLAASHIADLVLVPAGPLAADLDGTRRALADLRAVRRLRAMRPPGVLVVPSRLDRRRSPGEVFEALGEQVAPGLHHDAAHDLAFRAGEWVGHARPGSQAHREVLALAAAAFAALPRTSPASPHSVGEAQAQARAQMATARESAAGASMIPPARPSLRQPAPAPRRIGLMAARCWAWLAE